MSKFKVGDRVRCIHTGIGLSITPNSVYHVYGISSRGWPEIVNDRDVCEAYLPGRFELVTDTPCPNPVEWLKEQLIKFEKQNSNNNIVAIGLCIVMLRKFYGIDAQVVQRTEWVFTEVQS